MIIWEDKLFPAYTEGGLCYLTYPCQDKWVCQNKRNTYQYKKIQFNTILTSLKICKHGDLDTYNTKPNNTINRKHGLIFSPD